MRYFRENPDCTEILPADLNRIQTQITFADIKRARAEQDKIDKKAITEPRLEANPQRA